MNSRDDAERYKQRRLGCQVNKEVSLWQYRASWAPESNWLVTPNHKGDRFHQSDNLCFRESVG